MSFFYLFIYIYVILTHAFEADSVINPKHCDMKKMRPTRSFIFPFFKVVSGQTQLM